MARDTATAIKGSLFDVERGMAEVLTNYVGQLQAESQQRPIQQREWLAAFLGRSFFSSDDETTLVQQTKRVMNLRHATGEPMMYWGGSHYLPRGPYLVAEPQDYDPISRDSFFRFGIETRGSTFVGKISCNVVKATTLNDFSRTTTYERSEVDLLEVQRVKSSLRCEVVSYTSQDGLMGYVWGLPAIREAASQYPDANASALHNLERILPEMREAAASLTAVNPQ